MAQSILDLRDDLDDSFAGVELPLEDLREDLVDIVRVTAIHSDLQGLVVLLHLQIEGNLLHDLLLVDDEVVTELLLARVLRQLGELRKVYAQLHLVQDVVALSGLVTALERVSDALLDSQRLGVLLLVSGLFDYRERDALVYGKLASQLIELLFE